MPATINDLLLQRIARLGRMLAGCALVWPDEVLAAIDKLSPDQFTDECARRFISALRRDINAQPSPRDKITITIWLIEAREYYNDISNLAMQLEQDWIFFNSLDRLQRELRESL